MERTEAVDADRGAMLGSAVAFVDVEAVERVGFVESDHFLVAEMLGDNRSEADRYFGGIALDDGFLVHEVGGRFQSPVETNIALGWRELGRANH